MTNTRPIPHQAAVPARSRQSAPVSPDVRPASAQAAASGRRPGQGRRTHVSWYAAVLITMMLLLAAGWELWRWLLLIVTLD